MASSSIVLNKSFSDKAEALVFLFKVSKRFSNLNSTHFFGGALKALLLWNSMDCISLLSLSERFLASDRASDTTLEKFPALMKLRRFWISVSVFSC